MKTILKNILKVAFPFIFGGCILWWVYKDFNFSEAKRALWEMNWFWMFVSLVFEVLSHVLRGLRWRQSLEPLGVRPRRANCVNAIFLSYASNFVLPRLGEVSRCGVLSKYDGVSFSKSLGTVVTERLVDGLILGAMICSILLFHSEIFGRFFARTGTNLHDVEEFLVSPAFWITAVCVLAAVGLLVVLVRSLVIFQKVRALFLNLWEGILSLRKVRNLPLFVFFSLAIWGCYFLQFYLTFFCFASTSQLSLSAALAIFTAGSVAVIVPTPNGTGSWHFAVISMMLLYGISEVEAGSFALIVHGSQTLMTILLGVWALLALPLANKREGSQPAAADK